MHTLQKRFHDFVVAQDLFKEKDHVLLAVSGGLDSMVLAELFSGSQWTFAIAHCNFNLRGVESDGDEQFVRDWAEKNKVEIHSKRFDLGQGSIQLNARNARYEWFEELLVSHDYTRIVTAHHLNDSLETSLINLIRGTGIIGVGGIKPKSEKLIRPLLFASRADLMDYARDVKLEWREDSSNAKNDYQRNLLRHEVIPKMETMNPSLIDGFLKTSERLRLSADIVRDNCEKIREEYLIETKNGFELNGDWINKESDVILLAEILSSFGFNWVTTKEIFEALGKPGKTFESEHYILSGDRQSFFIKPIGEKSIIEMEIVGEGKYEVEDKMLRIDHIDHSQIDYSLGPNTIFLDSEKLQLPMQLRTWKEGDRFQPLGMQGHKKISDYLIDKKVPLVEKVNVLVLVSNNHIVWVLGYQPSEKFKIGEDTREVLRLTFH